MLSAITSELQRLAATDARVTLDKDFEPDVGELVQVELEDSYWHLLPDDFLSLLKELPDAAGAEAVRTAIEQKATFVWHGPSPRDSRDTST